MPSGQPDIDCKGLQLTDLHAQRSCPAGRAAFITGQDPGRTGLTTVGIPGAPVGPSDEDPTIAERSIGSAT